MSDPVVIATCIAIAMLLPPLSWHIASRRLGMVQANLSAMTERNDHLRATVNDKQRDLQASDEHLQRLQDELGSKIAREAASRQSVVELGQRLLDEQQQVLELRSKFEALTESLSELKSTNAKILSTQDEREQAHQRELERYESRESEQRTLFENIANEIIEKKGKSFLDSSRNSLGDLLQPFREQIDGFQKRVNEVHDDSIKVSSALKAEVRNVLKIGNQMSTEANNLSTAIKGDAQQRGAWGEAQLERTLEMSGLVQGAHFDKQSSFKDQEGKQKFTDYIVKLPDGKQIIIDSKVSLVAYDRSISAESAEAVSAALDEHAISVRTKIDDLASKDYTNLIGMRSPSFVLMFIPIEPAYIDALKHEKDLFGYGYDKGIVLVSHTTLIPILRTVANLWMMERSNQEAREISESAGEIFNQVCTVAERLHKLGGTLATASKHYNGTVTALAGQQGLYGKVGRFEAISAKVSKKLPAVEPSHIDFEVEKLELITAPSEPSADDDTASSQNGISVSKQIDGNA